MREVALIVSIAFIFFAILGGSVAAITEAVANHQCTTYERFAGIGTRRAIFDVCYVNTEDGWQRWDEYKARSTAKDALSREAP